MSEQSLTRRGALMVAASLGSAIAVADAQAGDTNSGDFNTPAIPKQFKLSVTLTDGQVVTFKANEAIIDFGTAAQLIVKPSGIMPIIAGGVTALTPTPEPNRRRVPTPLSEDPFTYESPASKP